MSADACPRCGLEYERCECPATKGAAADVKGAELAARLRRGHGRAIIASMLSGVKHPRFPEEFVQGKHVDTGRVTSTAVDGYLERWQKKERRAYLEWGKAPEIGDQDGH